MFGLFIYEKIQENGLVEHPKAENLKNDMIKLRQQLSQLFKTSNFSHLRKTNGSGELTSRTERSLSRLL